MKHSLTSTISWTIKQISVYFKGLKPESIISASMELIEINNKNRSANSEYLELKKKNNTAK